MVETATAEEVGRSIESDTTAVVNVLAEEDYEEGLVGWKERGHEVAGTG
jgi:hypothetical protein